MRDFLLSVASPEHLSLLGFLLLAAGLLGEVAILVEPFEKHWTHKPLGFAFAAVVLIGYVIGHIGDDAITARFETRATKAESALAKLNTSRTLTNEGAERLRQAMSPFKGQPAGVGPSPVTFETAALSEQLNKVLVLAGVQANLNLDFISYQVGIARGVVVRYTTGNKKGELFARTLVAALKADNIAAFAMDGLMETSVVNMIKDGTHTRDEPGFATVAIAVGDKP
jgi:hypothetical protein